jgi:hypothetical protein
MKHSVACYFALLLHHVNFCILLQRERRAATGIGIRSAAARGWGFWEVKGKEAKECKAAKAFYNKKHN